MRKFLSVTLAILFLISTPVTVNAAVTPSISNTASEADVVTVTSASGTKEIIPITVSPDKVQTANSSTATSPRGGNRIEFYDAAPDIVMIGGNNVVLSAGETVGLTVDPCVWAPEHYNLELGFWNEYTNTCYPEIISGGNVSDTFYYSGLPAGTYRVYVRNLGTTKLTAGYLLYSLSFSVG